MNFIFLLFSELIVTLKEGGGSVIVILYTSRAIFQINRVREYQMLLKKNSSYHCEQFYIERMLLN